MAIEPPWVGVHPTRGGEHSYAGENAQIKLRTIEMKPEIACR